MSLHEIFRSRPSLDGSRSSLDLPRSPLDPPLTPPPGKRQSRLSKTLASAQLVLDDKDGKPSKRERTKNILKKVFGTSHRDSKPPPPRPPPHLVPIDRRESLSKRKAPNLTISIHPVSKPSPLVLVPSPSSSSEDLYEEPTPTFIQPLSPSHSLPIASPVLDVVTPPTPPKTPSACSQSPHRPALPYTMYHLTSSRESLNIPLNYEKSRSSSSLNDQCNNNNADLSSHRLTHTADGLRIPRLEGEVPRSIGRRNGNLEKRDVSPARPLSFPRNADNSASKAMAGQRRSVNLLELRSALGGWDCEADAEDAKEHVLEMKKRAMEREERRRRSLDLEKDWNRWEASEQGGGGKKEIKWNF